MSTPAAPRPASASVPDADRSHVGVPASTPAAAGPSIVGAAVVPVAPQDAVTVPAGPRTELIDGHLRITPAQRERALATLRDAAADERLRFEELEARTAVVLAARTRAELAGPLYDLVPTAELPGATAEASLGEGPGMSWDHPLVLRGHTWWRTERFEGAWEVPPFLEVNASKGPVLLDFQRATILTPVIDIVINATWLGAVTLIVPEGWGVDMTQAMGGANVSVASEIDTRPAPGMPLLLIRGQVGGGITARYPKPRDLRRAESVA